MKIVVGFSGGVDSAVTTRLLQNEGHQVFGLYLDNSGEAARREAERSAERMGIQLRVARVRDALEEKVCRPFTESYLRGETPNPCVLCNPSVKFPMLLAEADRIGAERVATGHYARAEGGALYKGRPSNDQSYMLCRLTREQVARLILPLGDYEKTRVRALAAEWGLDAAHKPDSMEICFIPDKDYIRWLGERAALPGPGDFLFHGQVIGRHEGIHRWTVGQRRPGLWEGRKHGPGPPHQVGGAPLHRQRRGHGGADPLRESRAGSRPRPERRSVRWGASAGRRVYRTNAVKKHPCFRWETGVLSFLRRRRRGAAGAPPPPGRWGR